MRDPLVMDDPLAGSAALGTTMVDGYTPRGFIVNGVTLDGAVLLLPQLSLLFSVPALQQLTPRALSVFSLLEPIELLLIGSGASVGRVPAEARAWLDARRIGPEVLNTRAACSTFNYCVQEQRSVAAILFPNGSGATPPR